MKIVIIIYFILGLLFSLVGPLSAKINKAISDYKKPSIAEELLIVESKSKKNIILFEIILRLLGILFYPILFLVLIFDFFRSKQIKEDIKNEHDDKLLYFSSINGTGKIHCNMCNYQEEIVSFLHGHESEKWTSTGFQCQKCGKFSHIVNDMSNSQNIKCECGGDLYRDNPLFCPQCKSKMVSYKVKFIT